MKIASARFKTALLALCVMALLPASAKAVTIDGDQLDIHLDPNGNVQVLGVGQTSFSFYPPGEEAGDAGFFLGLPVAGGGASAGTIFGPPIAAGPQSETLYTPVSQSLVTGSGTPADPFTQVTTYNAENEAAGVVAEIEQTTTYVNGLRSFRQRWDVTNRAGAPLRFRASAGADLYLEGSDDGIGFFAAGPPRMVGGLSEATNRAGGLREVLSSPWDAFEESAYDDIWETIFAPAGSGLANSIDASLIDNGIGVQWDEYYATGLGDDASDAYEVEWQFGLSGLTASPPSALLGTGSFHQVTLTAADANGILVNNGTIRYQVSGANSSSGTVITGGNGQAKVGWVGSNAGTDTLTAYLDLNNDNSHDANEPDAAANATFVDPAPPSQGNPGPPSDPGTPPKVPAFALDGRPVVLNGVTTLVVVVPSAGRLLVQQASGGAGASISAKGKRGKKRKTALVKPFKRNPSKAGPVKVKIRPTKAGKKALAKKGRFKVKLQIAFTPKGSKKAQAFTRTVPLKVKGAKGGKGKGGKRR